MQPTVGGRSDESSQMELGAFTQNIWVKKLYVSEHAIDSPGELNGTLYALTLAWAGIQSRETSRAERHGFT